MAYDKIGRKIELGEVPIETDLTAHVVVEFGYVRREDGWYIWMMGQPDIGPFETLEACQTAIDDLAQITRSLGAVDIPLGRAN